MFLVTDFLTTVFLVTVLVIVSAGLASVSPTKEVSVTPVSIFILVSTLDCTDDEESVLVVSPALFLPLPLQATSMLDAAISANAVLICFSCYLFLMGIVKKRFISL